jgi:hypothetical protein
LGHAAVLRPTKSQSGGRHDDAGAETFLQKPRAADVVDVTMADEDVFDL